MKGSLSGAFFVTVTTMLYDVFISHASEDKDSFVRPLAAALKEKHIEVWYDEFSLQVGDSLRESIDLGLAKSTFGIVVLSPNFFSKGWAKRELNGLVARETAEDRRLILPIWHDIDKDEILKHSPILADVLGILTAKGLEFVVEALVRRIRPDESPLLTARNFLIGKGFEPPIISDEWWLNLVEIKEADLKFPDLNNGLRWIFPLPFKHEAIGRERGLNIAWTALQMDWSQEGTERKICQLTHPEIVLRYLKKWPGLWECAQENPEILALYVPQLTIPGFDVGLEATFDNLLKASDTGYSLLGYGRPDTTDEKEPLCGDVIAWRHPTFGNYTASELAKSFVSAHTHSYSRNLYSHSECLTWLISDESGWLPPKISRMLLEGMSCSPFEWYSTGSSENMWLHDAIYDKHFKPRSKPNITSETKIAASKMFSEAILKLGINAAGQDLANRFFEFGFIEKLLAASHTSVLKSRRIKPTAPAP